MQLLVLLITVLCPVILSGCFWQTTPVKNSKNTLTQQNQIPEVGPLYEKNILLSEPLTQVQQELALYTGAESDSTAQQNLALYKRKLVSECEEIIQNPNIHMTVLTESGFHDNKRPVMTGYNPEALTGSEILNEYLWERSQIYIQNDYESFVRMKQ